MMTPFVEILKKIFLSIQTELGVACGYKYTHGSVNGESNTFGMNIGVNMSMLNTALVHRDQYTVGFLDATSFSKLLPGSCFLTLL